MPEDELAARWAARRARTPVTRDYTYMNCGWVGPLSEPVIAAMRERLELEVAHGPTTRHVMEDGRERQDGLRRAGARMLGADPDEIALTGNTTEGVNIALAGIDLAPGDPVVTTNLEHVGGLIPVYWARHRRGAEVRFVRIAGDDGPGAVVEAFDRALGHGAKAVVLSEITYTTGQLLPLSAITELAHARGATVIVDGAQTAGHVPIDVHALGIDAYAVPSHKWLCGPSGLGLLYVRRERIPDVEPSKVSGRAAASYDYEGAFEPARDRIAKFEVSTLPSLSVAGMLAAVEQYLEAGPDAVWHRVRELNRRAESVLAPIPGVRVLSPRRDDSRSGHFVFAIDGLDPAGVSGWMQAEGRVVARSVRQHGAVRLSLHVYNTDEEIDRVGALVRRLAAGEVGPERLATFAPAGPEA